jgi:hypothetical protein
MKRGEWVATHQAVAFSKGGALLDGQHRLSAVVETGATVPMLVARDVPTRAFAVMDCGLKRGMRDRTGLESRLCDVATYLAGVRIGDRPPRLTAPFVRDVADAIEPYHAELMGACGAMRAKRATAPVRAAAALRLVGADNKQRAFVMAQYPALIHLRVSEMAPSMGALLRKCESYGGGGGELVRQGTGATAWLAFDIANKHRTAFRVPDYTEQYAEMRKVINTLTRRVESRKAA